MARLSAVICCQNAMDTLPAACESVAWCDELVIVDSGSIDGTADFARERADVFRHEPWRGYDRQKAFANTLASHDWVLMLDADEACTPELAEELRGLGDAELAKLDVLHVRRRNYLLGRPVRAWDPDWQSRVVHRERVRHAEESLHDARLPSSPERQRRLRGRILHKHTSEAGFEDYFGGRRLDARLPLVALQMYGRGRRARWWDVALRPWLTLLKLYLLKGGWRDGTFGLLVAQKTAVTTQLKYAALWSLEHDPASLQRARESVERQDAEASRRQEAKRPRRQRAQGCENGNGNT